MLNVLYRDNSIIVCLKPVGVLSTDEENGMPKLIRNEFPNENLKIFTVHRLDQSVGGLMVYALTKESAANLSKQITDKIFIKEYYAVIQGTPLEPNGRLDDLLFRDKNNNKTYVVKNVRKGVREASLEYDVLANIGGLSLVQINLLTGRTHQIRAQFSSRHMPLFGDRKYGSRVQNDKIALWSYHLRFNHPVFDTILDFKQLPPAEYPWTEFNATDGDLNISNNQKLICPLCGVCGGCRYINEGYEYSLAEKQRYVNDLLGKYKCLEPIIPAKNPYHYRNKVLAVFGFDKKGRIISGKFRTNSHSMVPVDSCLLEDELADRIIVKIRQMLPKYKLSVFSDDDGFLRYVLIRRSRSSGEVMVILVTSTFVFKSKNRFIYELTRTFPEITTVLINVNDKYTSFVLGKEFKVLFGKGYITDVLNGLTFRISPSAFYQINSEQTSVLYDIVCNFASFSNNESVLDAYCGTGTIGLYASRYVKNVIGVELNNCAIKDAVYNSRINGITNCSFVCSDTSDYLKTIGKTSIFDSIIMDPPRAGCNIEFLESVLRCKPSKIVYVSCNPETLARDLEILNCSYKVIVIQPVDMFPFTEHVETVVLLSQQRPNDKIRVELDLTEFDITAAEKEATYQEIKDYIREKHGVKVSSLYIAQTKEKMGIKERENYNLPKSVDSKQPQCPKEKETMIVEALKYFKMVTE